MTITTPTPTATHPAGTGSTRARALIARAAIACLIVSALVTQLIYEIQKSQRHTEAYARSIPAVVGDFAGTFTYLTNACLAGAFLIWCIWALRNPERTEPVWLKAMTTGATANVLFVGIFYNSFLRSTTPPDAIMWINETLHTVVPLALIIDMLVGPHRTLRPRYAWASWGIGVVWAFYTLIRGPLAVDRTTGHSGWYPYAFVDPRLLPFGNVGSIAVCLAVLTVIGLIALLHITVQNRRGGLVDLAKRSGSSVPTEPTSGVR
jgi:hypothetical protein